MDALLRAAPRNLVLATVPEEVRRRLLAGAEFRDLQQGSMLTHGGEPVSDVIFPLSGVLTITWPTPLGQVIAHGIRGRESAVYGIAAVRADPRASLLLVEIPGRAIAVPLADFGATLDTSVELQRAVLAICSALLEDAEDTLVCSRYHTLPGRVASSLLLLDTQCGGEDIPMTHERIAAVIGTSRPLVSTELGHLQKRALVGLHRGSIEIREREALAKRACACRARATRLAAAYAAGHLYSYSSSPPL